MKEASLVFIGGGFGSLLRYFLGKRIGLLFGFFPLSTFLANVIACIVFGLVLGIGFYKFQLNEPIKKLILIGFCGGLSTFSTFNAELYHLIKADQFLWAILYLSSSLVMCFCTFWFAIEIWR